ncbi:MAG: ATP:corrinoid adenosyltransferase BtuR/CobO/CobP [Sporomusa sp.]|nr:ATP:corrinoid adenosyltransferase BtuR/CobO/CobP [Sporomusa sp.]
MALACSLLDADDVIEFVETMRGKVEIILTGRYAPRKIENFADLVTRMIEIRHPFAKGLKARSGIEY